MQLISLHHQWEKYSDFHPDVTCSPDQYYKRPVQRPVHFFFTRHDSVTLSFEKGLVIECLGVFLFFCVEFELLPILKNYVLCI